MTTDFRALCAELSDALRNAIRVVYHEDGTQHISTAMPILRRARAALAEPEPARPTDEEIMELMPQQMRDDLAAAARALSGFDPDNVKAASVFRIILNRHCVDHACAVLARWGSCQRILDSSAPAPAGEVGELIGKLVEAAPALAEMGWDQHAQRILRAADLLQRLSPPQPVPVSERLPGPNVKVLAHYFNDLGKGRTICAIWVPAKTRSDSYGDDDFTEYDEETDNFYWPEGWYEAIENWDDLGWVKVDEGEVVYWQPLPKWPAPALPLPSPQDGEVEA